MFLFYKNYKAAIILLAFLSLMACNNSRSNQFICVKKGQFFRNDKPYYFVGANFWYGAILGSEGKGGNRARLLKELDFMQQAGITNLRVLVGAQGPEDQPYRVIPSLEAEPGKYNTELLIGLDFLLNEMAKRKMVAVLFLNNSWDWSGGYGQYLEWNGYGEAPCVIDTTVSWEQFQAFNGQFNECKPCIEQFHNHISFIVNRANTINGIKYINDPVIMAWEIGNEPRAFGQKFIPAFELMVEQTAALIKSIDPNHLVTTGTEGKVGCEGSIELFERIHANKNIDYLTFHVWPKNWRYIDAENIAGTIDNAIFRTNEYINEHVEVANRLNKPLVAEEFGLPRDQHGYSPSESTIYRDKYFSNIFDQVQKSAETNGILAGCNFWSYGGFGQTNNVWYKPGDDYLGDPPCEEQGLNSVFYTDSTIAIIKRYTLKISNR